MKIIHCSRRCFYLIPVIYLFTAFIFTGCASTIQNIPQPKTPVPKDMARIIFTRNNSILGSAVPHYVIDIGDNIEKCMEVVEFPFKGNGNTSVVWIKDNTYLLEYMIFANESKNVSDGLIKVKVKGLILKSYSLKGKDMETVTFDKESGVTYINIGDLTIYNEDSCKWNGYPTQITYDKSLPKGLTNIEGNRKLNADKISAQLIGIAGPGGSLVWDRPAGLMTLEVIEKGGHAYKYEPKKVEAGKVYRVNYNSPLGKLEITESDYQSEIKEGS